MSVTTMNSRIPTTFGLEPRYIRERRERTPHDGLVAQPAVKPALELDPDAEKLPCMDDMTPTLRQRVLDVARKPKYLSVAIALPVISALAALTLGRPHEVAHAAGLLLKLF